MNPSDDIGNVFRRAGQDFSQPLPSRRTAPQQTEDPFMAALSRLGGSRGDATSAYREHIGKMPKSEQYAPSKMRRLGGALAAAAIALKNPAAGAAMGQHITDAPYRNALESWQMKGSGLKEQADIESQDVKGQLEYIKQIREHQKSEATEARDIRRLELDERNAGTMEAYRQAQIADMENNDWIKDTDAQGNTVLYHPDGRVRNMGPSMAGREQANRERGTDIAGMNAATNRMGVSGNLGLRGAELGLSGQRFQHQQGVDIANLEARNRGLDISQQNAGAAGFIPAGEQFQAESLAVRDALKINPDWAGWVNPDGTIKKPSDYSSFGAGAPNPATDPTYQQFLATVEAAKQKRQGVRRPGVGVPGNVGPISFNNLPD